MPISLQRKYSLINPPALTSILTLLFLPLAICVSNSLAYEPIKLDQRISWPRLTESKWSRDSFWGERQLVCRESLLPSMTQLMEGTTQSHFVENFRIAAGWKTGKHRGPAWNDGDTYKWLEALAASYAVQPDDQTRRVMDEAIEAIAAAQRSDGYIHTPALIAARNDPKSAQAWGDPTQFEMYNFGHLMTAACVHFEVTQDRKFLEVALRAARYLENHFAKPNQELARHAICPAHYMGLIDLFHTTGDKRWLQLAIQLFSMRDLVEGGDDNQDRVAFREQREAVGHAVRANYLYAGAADLMAATDDATLWPALDACWKSVQQKKIYITGGCGALFDGASPDGSKQQSTITRIHQAYGRNYQLPNSTAHNETCAAIGNVLWNQRMWQLQHHAQYLDALETSLMNAVLAGVSLDGERFFYTNTLRQLDDMPTELRWSRERQAWISCYCCPPNVARTLATVQRYSYALGQQSLWVLMYGSNRLDTKLSDGTSLVVQQKSNYPWDGQVELILEEVPSSAITFQFRIPAWCEQVTIERNGKRESHTRNEVGFIELAGTWTKGDRISLNLEMPIRLMQAHPLVEECRGQVAVQRGPIVYCLESKDLPAGVRLIDVALASDSKTSDWKVSDVPESRITDHPQAHVVAIRADLVHRTARDPSDATGLYSNYQPAPQKHFQANLIPYYAWGNRGKSEMSVWIPILTP